MGVTDCVLVNGHALPFRPRRVSDFRRSGAASIFAPVAASADHHQPLYPPASQGLLAPSPGRLTAWSRQRGVRCYTDSMAKRQSPDPQDLSGARQTALPDKVKPSLATLVDEAPAGEDWLHEVKFDGYRILARIEGRRVKLISRNGLDWTPRFKAIAGALAKLKVKSALVDGEVVAVNAKGMSDFGALQDALSTSGATADLLYYAFDLLHVDGYDLRRCGLEDRKAVLTAWLVGAPSRIHYSDHHAGDAAAFFKSACGMALD